LEVKFFIRFFSPENGKEEKTIPKGILDVIIFLLLLGVEGCG